MVEQWFRKIVVLPDYRFGCLPSLPCEPLPPYFFFFFSGLNYFLYDWSHRLVVEGRWDLGSLVGSTLNSHSISLGP